MTINFEPKIGQVLECNYGSYRCANEQIITNDFDAHLPPEMVKNRLVVVVNAKIDRNACIVVPLSSTIDSNKVKRGYHVEVLKNAIPNLHYFEQRPRWAKGDLVQLVSKYRLNRPRLEGRGYLNQVLDREFVTQLQKAIIKAINASALIV